MTDRSAPNVALATCRRLPALDADNRTLIGPLARVGVRASAEVWDGPGIDWSGFDLTIVRCCWDYHEHRDRFLCWAAQVPALANPAEVLAWNTDKRYLAELADAGVPVVPTTWIDPGGGWTVPDAGIWVAKPSISIAGLDTGRYDASDPDERALLAGHVRQLGRDGRVVMIQPYQPAVDTAGETAMVFLNGEFSHAVRKAAVLDGPATTADHRFDHDGGLRLRSCRPTHRQLAVAEQALAGVPGGPNHLLYARVDLVPGADGEPRLLELELTEPQLFLSYAPGSADALAAAIASQVCNRRMSSRQ